MPQPQMPAMTNWRFEVDFEQIAWLTIDTPNAPVNRDVTAALSNSFGFGGHNVTLAVRRYTD